MHREAFLYMPTAPIQERLKMLIDGSSEALSQDCERFVMSAGQ